MRAIRKRRRKDKIKEKMGWRTKALTNIRAPFEDVPIDHGEPMKTPQNIRDVLQRIHSKQLLRRLIYIKSEKIAKTDTNKKK